MCSLNSWMNILKLASDPAMTTASKRRWFRFTIPALVVVAGILPFVWHPESPSPDVTIRGNLSNVDELAIGEAISASDQLISKRIRTINVFSPEVVEVVTGNEPKPWSGVGEFVTLCKFDGTWKVTNVTTPIY
jgi:hypothetical protein